MEKILKEDLEKLIKEESQILLPAVAARMNNTPFPEQCMENIKLILV